MLRFPYDALREALRGSSLAALGLAAVVAVVLFTGVYAYLAPSCSWDGVWYHESIVGFAIQERGFGWVAVPERLAYVNGYPKSAELLSLWCVIFSGRRLIELPQSIMAVVLLLGVFQLTRRFMADRLHALGLACALVLTPAVALQLRSTLTDVCFVAAFVAALHFVTRPEWRRIDLVLGGLAAGLVGSTKGTGVVIAPMLMLVATARIVLLARRDGVRRAVSLHLLVLAAASALFVPGYARNWQRTDNPVWPIRVEVPSLSLVFEGPHDFDMARPAASDELLAPPRTPQLRDTRDNGYGNVLPFILPIALCVAMLRFMVDVFRRRLGAAHAQLGALVLVLAPSILLGPGGWWWARLNLHLLVGAMVILAWVVGSDERRALAEGLMGALVVGSMITLYWSLPAWDIDRDRLVRFATNPAAERDLTPMNGTRLPRELAVARERELGPGAVIAYDGEYGFPSSLWNEAFSNRVVYLGEPGAPSDRDERLDRLAATWVVVLRTRAWDRHLSARPEAWEPIGDLDRWTRAYRRREAP